MASIRQRVTVEIRTQVRETYTPAIMKAALQAGSKEAVRQWQQRTIDGYDNRGRKLRRLKSSTVKRKERRLRKRAPRGRFAMTEARQIARETGQTLRDMRATAIKAGRSSTGVTGGFTVDYATERSRRVAANLEDGGRPITGFAPENTAQGRKERRAVLAVMATVLRTNAKVKGTITARPV